MSERVRARRLTSEEGRRLQQMVRRGNHGSIWVRRAMIVMASSSGTPVPAIARLVAADEDTVRDVRVRHQRCAAVWLDFSTTPLAVPAPGWTDRDLDAVVLGYRGKRRGHLAGLRGAHRGHPVEPPCRR